MNATPRTLTQQQNHATSYSVEVKQNGKVVGILGFTQRKTKANLIKYFQANSDDILNLIPESMQDDEWTYSKSTGFNFPANVNVNYGITEREYASQLNLV